MPKILISMLMLMLIDVNMDLDNFGYESRVRDAAEYVIVQTAVCFT